MEHSVRRHIERLPEGVYLATSDDIQGLIAQGRTIGEAVEIARDVAKKLIESQPGMEHGLPLVRETLDYRLIVNV